MNAWAVVVAAGRGERADLGTNKVFYPIGGVSVLTCCLRALESSGLFAGVALVLAPSDFEAYERLCAREGRCALVKKIAQGGNTRQASVENGLAVVPEEAQIVAIHDAARPFVSRETLQMSIELAQDTGSGVACTSVVDTIKQVDESGVVHTIDRASLRAAQTPQTFQRAQIVQAYCRARELGWTATDDADIYQRYFGRVTLFTAPGSERNIKLTTKEDFARMQTLCGFKVGIG